MESEPNLCYPSAFSPCVLRCKMEGGHPMCSLHFLHSLDTIFCQLSWKQKVYEGDGSLFRCDYMQARDGGLPFLIVTDTIMLSGCTVEGTQTFRTLGVNKVLQDLLDMSSPLNEYRVRAPEIFPVTEINNVITFTIPNLYGIANGVAFVRDSHVERSSPEENNFIMRKTKYPECYELYLDSINPVPGNNIAYIKTLEQALKVADLLKDKNSVRVTCAFNEQRQKWFPLV